MSIGIDQAGAVQRVAGLVEQGQRLTEVVALRGGVGIDRIGVGFGEDTGRRQVLDRIEDLKLLALLRVARGKGQAIVIAVDALVLAIK